MNRREAILASIGATIPAALARADTYQPPHGTLTRLSVDQGNYGKLFDANGVELHSVVACELETGVVERTLVRPDCGDGFVCETTVEPHPLRFEPYSKTKAFIAGRLK